MVQAPSFIEEIKTHRYLKTEKIIDAPWCLADENFGLFIWAGLAQLTGMSVSQKPFLGRNFRMI